MKLVVGLGNPGREYEKTYHNIGFLCVDKLVEHCQLNPKWKIKKHSNFCQVKIGTENVVLLKPQTYMNNSGQSILEMMTCFKIKPTEVVVFVDDIDLPLGAVRFRQHGSAGTHNGLRSIVSHVGSEFARIKIGIGNDKSKDLAEYVLSQINQENMNVLEDAIKVACGKAMEFVGGK